MKTKDKVLVGLGLAAVASAVVFEVCRQKGKEMYNNYFPRKNEEVNENEWLANAPYEIHHIINHSGMKLTGYHVPKENAEFLFVLVHGYHSRALNMSKFAKAFYDAYPCDVFLPDLRAHGNSDGDSVGWGYEDKDDLKEWIYYLSRINPTKPIVVFGISMGGATVCHLSSEKMPNVKAIVEDCGFSDLYEEFNHQSKKLVHMPFAPFYFGANQEVKKKHGYKIKESSSIESVKNAKYPMMFIHGLEDEVVPSYMVYDLYNACPTEKQLFVVKDAKHGDCIDIERENYLETLKEFLEEHLA